MPDFFTVTERQKMDRLSGKGEFQVTGDPELPFRQIEPLFESRNWIIKQDNSRFSGHFPPPYPGRISRIIHPQLLIERSGTLLEARR
jgi:hypothetical protein